MVARLDRREHAVSFIARGASPTHPLQTALPDALDAARVAAQAGHPGAGRQLPLLMGDGGEAFHAAIVRQRAAVRKCMNSVGFRSFR